MTDETGHAETTPPRVGRRTFVHGAGAVAGAAALASTLPAGSLRAATLPAGASAFTALATPLRVVDTRAATHIAGYQRLDPRRIRIPLRDQHGVPADATAVVATLTGVNMGPPTWMSVFPSGAAIPVVSNLNMVDGPWEASANLVTVKLGPDGAVDVASKEPCEVVFDLIGYYTPMSGAVAGGRYVGLDTAQRVIDTRPDHGGGGAVGADSISAVDLSNVVPADASAAVINITATQTAQAGYCTVFPYSLTERPASSSLNWNTPQATRAAAVIAQVDNTDGRRRIKIFCKSATHLIIDVTGYYTGSTSTPGTQGAFVPLDPVRILDTRRPEDLNPQTPGGVLWPQWYVEARIPGEAATQASSVLVNLTGVQSRGPGYLTIWPAWTPRPATSNVNFARPNAVVPNHAITRITSDRGLQVFTSHGAAVVVDLCGYFVGAPGAATLAPSPLPPPPPITTPWTLTIPGLNISIPVIEGNADAVTDAGLGWHWTGTGNVGEAANIAIFAHRSEAGGPFQHVQYLQPGHEWWLDTRDGRRYVYVMADRRLTDYQNRNILDATRIVDAPSCALVACTVGFDSTKTNYPDRWAPTSKLYRIVVVGRLDRWFAR